MDKSWHFFDSRKDSFSDEISSGRLLDLFEEYEVDYFIGGHSHKYGKIELEGTVYVTSGVVGGISNVDHDIGYLEFYVTDSNIKCEFVSKEAIFQNNFVRKLQGARIFLFPILIFCWIKVLMILCVLEKSDGSHFFFLLV